MRMSFLAAMVGVGLMVATTSAADTRPGDAERDTRQHTRPGTGLPAETRLDATIARVQEILAQVDEEEPASYPAAVAELVKLGPPGLEALKTYSPKPNGQFAVRNYAIALLTQQDEKKKGGPIHGLPNPDFPKPLTIEQVVDRMYAKGRSAEKAEAVIAMVRQKVRYYPTATEVFDAGTALLAKLGKPALPPLDEAIGQAQKEQASGPAVDVLRVGRFRIATRIDPKAALRERIPAEDLKRMIVQVAWAPASEGLFSDRMFYGVIARQWPVAQVAPEGLGSHNVVAVDSKGDATLLASPEALQDYFKKHLPPVKDEASAKEVLRVWLALTPTFSQDGLYRFRVMDDQVSTKRSRLYLVAQGVAAVERSAGNEGQIKAALAFDGEGKLAQVEEKREIKPGVRPRCQATRLLDKDDLVRWMAQRDLLVMGELCGAYLAEQREKASGELRSAIEAIELRIAIGDR